MRIAFNTARDLASDALERVLGLDRVAVWMPVRSAAGSFVGRYRAVPGHSYAG
jgi:hypothetical protein